MRPYERLSQFYDTGWGDFSKQYSAWIKELISERGLAQADILDLACGTGILAINLAKYGHIVHGIDISPQMINKAKAKANTRALSGVSFEVQDIICFDVNRLFDIVTCTYDSINYIRKLPDLRKMLKRVASALREGGLLVFDSNTKILYQSYDNDTHARELNGEQIIEKCSYDSTRNMATTTFSFSDGTYEIHKQRSYDYALLSPILISAGLRVINLFSWFDIMPYTSETAKLFCVAQKNTFN